MTLAESLANYIEERKELQDQSLELSEKLSKAKFGKRGVLRRTLRKIKRSLRRMDRQIRGIQNEMRKEGKNDVQEVLAMQGIDGRSNQISGIASAIGNVAQGITGAMGGGVMGAVGGGKNPLSDNSARTPVKRSADDSSNNNMLMIT